MSVGSVNRRVERSHASLKDSDGETLSTKQSAPTDLRIPEVRSNVVIDVNISVMILLTHCFCTVCCVLVRFGTHKC